MAQVQVRIVAETVITVDTENLDNYEELDTYLKGVPVEDATSKQLAVAMVRWDDDEDSLALDEMEWKVLGVSTLD
jgi:hypothetical protein